MQSTYSHIGKMLLGLCVLLGSPVWATDYWQGQSLPPAWQQYLQRSSALLQQDLQQLNAEVKQQALLTPNIAVKHPDFGLSRIENDEQAEAVLSFQTPSGGWSKRTDMSLKRQRGQYYGSEPAYVPTFDNGATTTQLGWLAQYYPQASLMLRDRITEALERGVILLLQAQYPNGGFPQSYPLRGGYHDAITLNDDVMYKSMQLLWQVAHDKQYAMLRPALREQAKHAFFLAVDWLLAQQVNVKGQRTVWTAQHHPLTGVPVAARKFEQIALVSSESAHLLQLLLRHVAGYPGVKASLASAAAWLQQHQINDKARFRDDTGLKLIDKPGAVVWARFYDINTGVPVFFDRDGQTYLDVSQISLERQQGYGWYQSEAAKFLAEYDKISNE